MLESDDPLSRLPALPPCTRPKPEILKGTPQDPKTAKTAQSSGGDGDTGGTGPGGPGGRKPARTPKIKNIKVPWFNSSVYNHLYFYSIRILFVSGALLCASPSICYYAFLLAHFR